MTTMTATTIADTVLETRQGQYNLSCIYNFIDGFTTRVADDDTGSAFVFDISPYEPPAILLLYNDFTGKINLPGGDTLPFAVDSVHLNERVRSILNAAQSL